MANKMFNSLLSADAEPPISFVQQKVGSAADGSSPVTVTFDVPVTAGNSVLVQIAFDPSKAAFSVGPNMVGGDQDGNPLGMGVENAAANNIWLYHFYYHQLSGGPTAVTFTLDTAVPVAVNASEWHNLANAAPESTNANDSSNDIPLLATALQPSSSNNLCIASYATVGDNYDSGPTNGWTRMTPAGGGGGACIVVAGAGTAAVNGNYTERGTHNGFPYYNLVGEPDDWSDLSIYAEDDHGNPSWNIRNVTIRYASAGDPAAVTPDLVSEWLLSTGINPTPTVTAGVLPGGVPTSLETAYLIQTATDAANTAWGLDNSVDWSSIGCAFGH